MIAPRSFVSGQPKSVLQGLEHLLGEPVQCQIISEPGLVLAFAELSVPKQLGQHQRSEQEESPQPHSQHQLQHQLELRSKMGYQMD
ncbi:hypothetical protein OGAPHI_001205 [Ogataea philodendri]|uniref:Uncharacterized protein n=1 Tax=Ogataea philodendri TaxID=1378263 RepID=A0A9P8PFN8_9ASCO|nr:uncharacterized protein OGAPHI_001205 [Ogataea philodendri]KAH3670690.1 hypothetical protein OGAPHI_001205 [Ogataea philodendri]